MIAEEDGFVPAVNKFGGINYRIIHLGTRDWVLMQIAAQDMTPINDDPDCIVLPDLTLDTTWGQLPANVRNDVTSRLTGAGFDTADIKTSTTVRQLLNYLGRQIDLNFDCERGDVRDLP